MSKKYRPQLGPLTLQNQPPSDLEYATGPNQDTVNTLIGFSGGVLIGSIFCSALWISWVIFDFMSPLIKTTVIPIVKIIQGKS